jgi:hypothetical protein
MDTVGAQPAGLAGGGIGEPVTAEDLLLKRGARLLHIGPHKTGTSAIQGALHAARERLAAAGVIYPGRGRQTLWPILAITGQPALLGEPRPNIAHWDLLVQAVAAAGDQRVVLSSEFFAETQDSVIPRVVSELGGERVHVVVTLRPLWKIMPSQWQQYVQNGFRMPYGEWLAGILRQPPKTPTPGFWRRHRHDDLVGRWAAVAGPQNVTVVVVDESDRTMLLRTFEAMLGLPDRFLALADDVANRSLTLAETEIVRRLNQEFKLREWPDGNYPKFMRYGAVQQMKSSRQPGPDEARITTPGWAVERATEIAAEMADNIKGIGVRVVGDLGTLSELPPALIGPVAGSGPALPLQPAAADDGPTASPSMALITPQALAGLRPGHPDAPPKPARSRKPAVSAPLPSPDQLAAQADAPLPLVPADAAVHAIVGAFLAGGVTAATVADRLSDVGGRAMTKALVRRIRQRALTRLRPSAEK